MTIDEAKLEDVGSGLAPTSPGWFVVNTGDAAWVRHEAFGGRCVFESSERVLQDRPDLEPQWFNQTGFTLAVLEPGSRRACTPRAARRISSCSAGRACC